MPPRYEYWTIIIDGKATAFRAREREELLPTFNQLARKNSDIVMRYFARGRIWDNPEQAQWASRNRDARPGEPRDRAWRPGGEHKDPRARFEKRATGRPEKAGRPGAAGKAGWAGKPVSEGGAGKPGWARGTGKTGGPGKTPRTFGQKPRSWDRKPFHPDQKPSNRQEDKTRFEGRPKDRRPPKIGAAPGKRGGRWNRPPKRDKPR